MFTAYEDVGIQYAVRIRFYEKIHTELKAPDIKVDRVMAGFESVSAFLVFYRGCAFIHIHGNETKGREISAHKLWGLPVLLILLV